MTIRTLICMAFSLCVAANSSMAQSTSPTTRVFRTLSGNGMDSGQSVAVDAAGNTYITGLTTSTKGFPAGVNATVNLGGKDCSLFALGWPGSTCPGSAFVIKLDAAGNVVSTVLFGGSGYTTPTAVQVDDKHVYIGGSTNSPVITTANNQTAFVARAYGTAPRGALRAFVAEFSLDLTNFQVVTTLAASGSTVVWAMAVSNYSPYLVGSTCGSGFYTTTSAFQKTNRGGCDAFVTKLDSQGTLSGAFGPVYSTLLGGLHDDSAGAVAVDVNGAAWVAGRTCSANFPVASSYYGSAGVSGSCNAYLTELDPSGSTYQHSVYWGGNVFVNSNDHVDDSAWAIVLNGAGGAYVAGSTTSQSFYKAAAAGKVPLQSAFPTNGAQIGFVTFVDANFQIPYSTYLGGGAVSFATSIGKNSQGQIYVGGEVSGTATNFPNAPALASGGYVVKLDSTLDTALWTSFPGTYQTTSLVARTGTTSTSLWTTGYRNATSASVTDGGTDVFTLLMTDPTVYTAPPSPPVCRVCVF